MSSDPAPQKETLLFPDLFSNYQEGRDELNLAEFPISAIGSRLDPSIKTILFQDTAFDKKTGKTITRKLTITASDAYGLPTAHDDEVLLGLLQISRIQNFASSTVKFTTYQLLRILGWGATTKNYRRVRESINRWLGVSLYYQNAWRDKATNNWIDPSFHFLDNANLLKSGDRSEKASDSYSMIKWNDVIFKNFREGNLKILDFHRYRSLKGGITKRLYRFLDKRFHLRNKLTFNLEAFACEKIGLTRPTKVNTAGKFKTDIAQIKRRLLQAVQELEALNYIKTIPLSERFTKDAIGTWAIHFERSVTEQLGETALDIDVEELTPLEGRLISHGVTKSQAQKLVLTSDNDTINAQLEALEFLLSQGGNSVPENRGGWLVKAINENYGPPRGFRRTQLSLELGDKAEKESKRQEKLQRAKEKEETEQADWRHKQDKIREYLGGLAPQELSALEAAALDASPIGRGKLPPRVRRSIIDAHVWDVLESQQKEA